MEILKSRRGVSLATVLGITMFVIASVTTVFVLGYRQARLVDVAIENTEEYANATARVEATLAIIVRDQNLEPAYLADLATFMGVTIVAVGADTFSVTGTVDVDASVTSYIAYVDGLVTPYESFLQYTGSEPGFTLDPTVTATTMLAAFVTEFADTEYAQTAPTFTNYASIMTYVDNLTLTTLAFAQRTPASITAMANPTITVDTYCTASLTMPATKSLTITNANMFIDGNLNLSSGRNLTITGGVLFVNGTVTLRNNATLTGTVVALGSVSFSSNVNTTTERLRGTVYTGNDFTTDRQTVFGDAVYGPSFVFAADDANLDNNAANTASGIVYVLAHDYYGNNAGVALTGGVYATVIRQISPTGIAVNPDLDAGTALYPEGVATNLLPAPGVIAGFRYTSPDIG